MLLTVIDTVFISYVTIRICTNCLLTLILDCKVTMSEKMDKAGRHESADDGGNIQ